MAIFNSSSAALTLADATVSGNSSLVFGGGIWNYNELTLQGSSVSKNSAAEGGGGIFNCCGFSPVTVKDSTIDDNAAGSATTLGSGGGISNLLVIDMTLKDTTVSGNTATNEGGGIDNSSGTTTLCNSTVTNNTAGPGDSGGGVFDFSGTVLLNDSTVKGNGPDNCAPPGNVPGCTG